MRQDFFEEFCCEAAKWMNRLRMEGGAGINAAKRELARIEVRRKKLFDLVLDDHLPASEAKEELLANAKRREELEAQLKVADEPPPLLASNDGRPLPLQGGGTRVGAPARGHTSPSLRDAPRADRFDRLEFRMRASRLRAMMTIRAPASQGSGSS